MVKHIVLFKLKDEAPADEKLAAMNSFKAAIEALPAKISVIRKIEVGLNINPAEAWNIALYSEFDTLDDVKYYATHPDHVAAGKLIALEYGACNDENCLPPTQVPFKFSGKAEGAAKEAAAAAAETKAEEQPAKQETVSGTAPVAAIGGADGPTEIKVADKVDLWKPVISELNSLGETTSQEDMSWIYIFITGFAGGLLALFTPCVWPIIPMTVSFFLKRSKDKKKGIRDAWTYGASIVVIYVTLGLAITLVFGASALNALSTNAVFNILFCLMLVVFAASFFGAFEITLPSKWSTAVDSKAEATSGLLSIFLMAFTLSLVSFSCTGPIIGFLLVQVSTTGSVVAPAIGMLGFAIALALPFTLFALFPSWSCQCLCAAHADARLQSLQ